MTPSKKAFLIILGSIGAIVLGGAGIFYLLDKQLVSLNEEVGKLKADQQVIRSQINIYETARQKVEELAFVQGLADQVLPQEREQANAVAELKSFVNSVGLELESVAFTGDNSKAQANLETSQTEQAEGLAGVRILPTTIVIKPGATYRQVLQLLERIERNQRKMQVIEITLIPNEEGGSTFSTITMSINIYLRT